MTKREAISTISGAKGEMKFKTDDNYTIKAGSQIYYTGDMANLPGDFIVTNIQPCNFYGLKVTLKEKHGGDNRKFTLTPTNFDSGPGRRFKPKELVMEERLQAMKRLRND